MKTFLFFLILLIARNAESQYYYDDIRGARDFQEKIKGYVTNKVRSVNSVGYDERGTKTSDFGESQEIHAENNVFRIALASRTGQNVARQSYQFDDKFRLISLTDSSRNLKTTSVYSYDNRDNIILIKTTSQDSDSTSEFSETEEHQWIYNSAGRPQKMWRILNGKDSIEYRFDIDEKGNVADETMYRRGVAMDSVLYFYDDNNRLTDIVRYNKKLRKLLPDIMFEYDDNGRVIQKITTLSPLNRDYLIWRYIYDEKGLKTKEALFNKQKELTGRIEYQYGFF